MQQNHNIWKSGVVENFFVYSIIIILHLFVV